VLVITQTADGPLGAEVVETVMRALPQWFGLEEPLLEYVEAARTLPTYLEQSPGPRLLEPNEL